MDNFARPAGERLCEAGDFFSPTRGDWFIKRIYRLKNYKQSKLEL
ncbi:hypothetical protein EDWATA_03004 [Edwardsiella tarda ATCC 23685]|uniref:Uncharacterized protein n=1 Tax=Edwardsiella tarda ATCC 23685 TaxID=500638 RepID=D4F8B7_EDWTA|nr:hypothetical protein EDWATA_03004 [Edwardsiella tarda ATCC 23685]